MTANTNIGQLNVVLDIAPVGWGWNHKQHVRGVNRVADKLLSGLLASPECDLSFVATSSVFGSRQFIAEVAPQLLASFHHTRRQVALSRWAQGKQRWVAESLSDRRLHLRGCRWLAQRAGNYADSISANFDVKKMARADIYHSPLGPIPKAINHTRLKRFLTVHDLIPLTHSDSVNGLGIPLLRRQLDSLTDGSRVLCVSNDCRNDLLNCIKLPPENVFVIPLAASSEDFYQVTDRELIQATLQQYAIPDAPYFLALSSFDPRKNFGHIIHCFSELVAMGEVSGCNLVIVGSNPERNRFVEEAIARYPQLKARIIMPGFIPDTSLAAIYSGATAFLFPSLCEGFGMPPLEAMQCGTPVISSNTTSLPEVIGPAGILLAPLDRDAWCQAMIQIYRDTALREELRKAGLQQASGFTWQRFTHATLAAYRSALSS